MKFLLEFKSFYKEGDIVLVEYWYNDMVTPVKILEKLSKVSYKVSHNVSNSKRVCNTNASFSISSDRSKIDVILL